MKHSILTPEGVIEKEFTAEEVAEREAQKEAAAKRDAELYEKKAKAKADRKSGNEKLLSLGLTQDQVTSLTGYDPKLDETE